MTIVYINGHYTYRQDAVLGAEDRATCFGDGVYEVMLIKQGVILDEAAHFQRLQRSLDGLKIERPMSDGAIKLILKRLLRVNHLLRQDASVYLQISRGVAKRDHGFPENALPSLFISVTPVKYMARAYYEQGAAVITAEDIRWLRRDIKSTSLLPNILARQQAIEANVQEAILVEADGTVTEGSSTNVFMVDDAGVLFTHPADHHILGGVTRQGVIAVAKKAGVKVKEQCFSRKALENAQEIFITSTTKHIFPITLVDGKAVGTGKVGKVTKQLMQAYEDFVNAQIQTELSCKAS